jgi:predicted GNAT family acetyltransferase
MKVKKFLEYITENSNIQYSRSNGNIVAIQDKEIVGEIALYDYWSELEYVDDDLKNEIIIPHNYEFVGMIDSTIEGQGVATNMLKYAVQSTDKKGIAISKLFIAENAIHTIMKKLNAISIPDWYLLDK